MGHVDLISLWRGGCMGIISKNGDLYLWGTRIHTSIILSKPCQHFTSLKIYLKWKNKDFPIAKYKDIGMQPLIKT